MTKKHTSPTNKPIHTDATVFTFSLPPDPSSTRLPAAADTAKKQRKLQHFAFAESPTEDILLPSPPTELAAAVELEHTPISNNQTNVLDNGEDEIDDNLSLTTFASLQGVRRAPTPAAAPEQRSTTEAPASGSKTLISLQQWLKAETNKIHKEFRHLPTDSDATSYITLAAEKGECVYEKAFSDLFKHLQSRDRIASGLLQDIWKGHVALTDTVHSKLLNEIILAHATIDDLLSVNQANAGLLQGSKGENSVENVKRQEEAEAIAAAMSMSSEGGMSGRRGSVGPRGSLARGSISAAGAAHLAANRRSTALSPAFKDQAHALSIQNANLQGALEDATVEIATLKQSLKSMKKLEEAVAAAEAKAAQAEEARDALRQREGEMTPRPHRRLEFETLGLLKAASNRVASSTATSTAAIDSTATNSSNGSTSVSVDKLDEKTLIKQLEVLARTHLDVDITELAAFLGPSPLPSPPPPVVADIAAAVTNPNNKVTTAPVDISNSSPSLQQDPPQAQQPGTSTPATATASTTPTDALPPPTVQPTSTAPHLEQQTQQPISGPNPVTTSTTTSDITSVASNQPENSPSQQQPAWQLSPTVTSLRHCLSSTPDTSLIVQALELLRQPTATSYTRLEDQITALKSENHQLLLELSTFRASLAKADAAKRRHEEEALLDKKNAIQQYLDLLSSQGEEVWKDSLIGMGLSPDVPKVFRHAGKVRNKKLSKRDTEKLVKELWKERMADPAVAAGRAPELVEFLGSQLQKRLGIAAAVVEMAYNFIYGLWLFKWDADCELFLKILAGETPEDVYIAQVRLQQELQELFEAMDRAKGTATTGTLSKEEMRIALLSYWRVDEPGGKTLQRFDEAMQALNADQPGETVEWKKIFEEDREFNQGEFAECVRDQFLQERMDYFNALEAALYGEAGSSDTCTRDTLIAALMTSSATLLEKEAKRTAAAVFPPGIEELSVKALMKKISKGAGSSTTKERASVAFSGRKSSGGKVSISVAAGKAAKGQPGGGLLARPAGQPKMTDSIARALEAVRKEWIRSRLPGVEGKDVKVGLDDGNSHLKEVVGGEELQE